ncbi:MAG TPA: ribosomal protein S18-alanine N-acetyltransferase [Terriglobia bacterium]|nr:ribosomal protein S18-alanine N-acetyltransferase [Terriglobia bacterium]
MTPSRPLTRPSGSRLDLSVREFSPTDVPAILAIQRQTHEAARWNEAGYAHLAAEPGGLILVAEAVGGAGEIAGFAAAARVVDEAELRNLAVGEPYRRRGVAKTLLGALHERLRAAGVRHVYLEVRPSNQAALALYHSAGYAERSRRKDYYQEPAEDALVLSLELKQAAERPERPER